jgi:hypothetical protein
MSAFHISSQCFTAICYGTSFASFIGCTVNKTESPDQNTCETKARFNASSRVSEFRILAVPTNKLVAFEVATVARLLDCSKVKIAISIVTIKAQLTSSLCCRRRVGGLDTVLQVRVESKFLDSLTQLRCRFLHR